MNAKTAALIAAPPGGAMPAPQGLDGMAVCELLQGAVLRGLDPLRLMADAGIDPVLYANPNAAIGGRDLVRLVRIVQIALDDVYLGFMGQGCRLALETERILCLLQAGSLGEAIRISVRFTNAMAPDVDAMLTPEPGGGLRHSCAYRTVPGVDRSILVWIRFMWIDRFFGWLIGRPLQLRGISIRGAPPRSANGFDRFALLGRPVRFDAPVDALSYDPDDLNRPLLHRSAQEYYDYYANEADWFAGEIDPPDWSTRTQKAIVDLQRSGFWFPTVEQVAERLAATPRRLRYQLAREGENFQHLRTRLRGEAAGAYLLASDLPIQEIGSLLGFSEPGAFSRHFIAWAGTSPSAYRARHTGDPHEIAAASALLGEWRQPAG